MGLLTAKIAIVTGASSGIGRAIAGRFAVEGASMVIADTIETPLEDGPTTKELIERFGRLDVIVNSAAIYTSTNLLEPRLNSGPK
jgi:glucose 1-dehydrogenase